MHAAASSSPSSPARPTGHARPPVFTGQPRFADAGLDRQRAQHGPASAWAALVDGRTQDEVMARLAQTTGPFAVGHVDPTGRVMLAVDRFARHTLCWRVIDGQLHFAERADTLARLEPVAELDPQSLYDYLYFHVIPAPRTVFRGVHRLPPAHCLWFDHGQISVTPYWLPRFEEPARPDFDALAAEFRTHVQQAVADALDGSKPACFLSGGTDSSTVAGMIQAVAGQVDCYSIGFEAEGYDEMAYARIAAQRFKANHHEYYVTPDDLVRSIPEVAAHADQPFGNSSILPAYYCARMAHADGVTRLLAGDGGDELFGGNARYAKQRVFGFYEGVPAPLRSGVLEPLLERSPLGRLPLARKGRSYVEQAKVPLPDRLQQYNLLNRLGEHQVLTAEFLAKVSTEHPLAHQRAVWRLAPEPASALNRMLAFDWRYTLAEADLPKVNHSTALAGVGVAFPFLDDALLDFSLRLPTEYKLKGLKLRWFFKEALRGFLPDEILVKKKQGFGLPFGVWAFRHAPLKALAAQSLHALGDCGIVRREFIEQLLNELLPQHPGYYGEMVWILMMMEQWMQAQPTPTELHL